MRAATSVLAAAVLASAPILAAAQSLPAQPQPTTDAQAAPAQSAQAQPGASAQAQPGASAQPAPPPVTVAAPPAPVPLPRNPVYDEPPARRSTGMMVTGIVLTGLGSVSLVGGIAIVASASGGGGMGLEIAF